MLIAVTQKIQNIPPKAEGVELRLDYFSSLNIKSFRDAIKIPVIFTLRKKSQGGFYRWGENQRLKAILSLCEFQPDFLDLEYDIPLDFIQKINAQYPKIKLIRSYHDFKKTPKNLIKLLTTLQHPSFFAYKIATKANSIEDSLRMLKFVTTYSKYYKLIGLCMGELGQCTRILSSMVGNLFHYASINEQQATAPGQFSLAELIKLGVNDSRP